MFRYRLYTEDLNEARLCELFSAAFDSYTVFHAEGRYKTKCEWSLIFEVITQKPAWIHVSHLAEIIKKINKQESVLLTHEKINGGLI